MINITGGGDTLSHLSEIECLPEQMHIFCPAQACVAGWVFEEGGVSSFLPEHSFPHTKADNKDKIAQN